MAGTTKPTNVLKQTGIESFINKAMNNNTQNSPVSGKRTLSSPENCTPPPIKPNIMSVTNNTQLVTEKEVPKLPPDLKLLYDSLSEKTDKQMVPIETDITDIKTILWEEPVIHNHVAKVKTIKSNQKKLENTLNRVEHENKELKQKLNSIEDKLLENNIVLTGISEEKFENPGPRRTKIDLELVNLVKGETHEECLKTASEIEIVDTEQIGKYNPTRGRPISIRFVHKKDVDLILASKKKLNKGVFIDKQYSEETEYERKRLRPVLSVARKLEEYRGKCKLEGTDLIIKGKCYSWNNLHDLPENISTHKVSSRQDATHYGFFSELNPL